MRITLIHNPGAGSGSSDGDYIAGAIRAAGHDVVAVSGDADDWTAALAQPADLVAVSGGDGTIGRVARRMIGRGVPLAALAAGTANNIALTLGVEELSVEQQIAAWPTAKRFPFDVVMADGPWGCDALIEGLGCGILAWSIRHSKSIEDELRDAPRAERLAKSLRILKERVGAFPTTHVRATLDGRDISGDYVLFEAMNTQLVGPNLFLAPDSHVGDGMLDVVFAVDADRARLREHLASWQRGALHESTALDSARGRVLTMQWTGFDLHLDDRLWPDAPRERFADATIEARAEQHAVEFLVP
jgi:diacylglycerol kinase family enzyme